MPDAEGVNFSVGPMRRPDGGKDNRKIPHNTRYDNPTLNDILLFINNLSVGPKSKEHLEKIAQSVPNGSLAHFRKNYQKYLNNLD